METIKLNKDNEEILAQSHLQPFTPASISHFQNYEIDYEGMEFIYVIGSLAKMKESMVTST